MARATTGVIVVVAALGALAMPPARAASEPPIMPPLAFAPRAYNPGTAALSVATADFTGDGRVDVAMMSGVYRDLALDNKLYLYVQTEAGTLAPPVRYDTHAKGFDSYHGVTAGDLDADGDTDVVLTSSRGIDLFLQDGGTLVTGDYFPVNEVWDADLVDLDGDGHLDIAVTYIGGVELLRGLGGGQFAAPVRLTATLPGSKEFGDVTGDGRVDLVAYRYSNVYVFAGRGDGTVSPAVQYPAGDQSGLNRAGLVLGDFSGDGRTDIAVPIGGDGTSSIAVLSQRDNGTLAAPQLFPGPDRAAAMVGADLNLDGATDLVASVPGAAAYLVQRPGSGFDPPRFDTVEGGGSYGASAVTVGDVTGDGLPDIVMAAKTSGLMVLRSTRQAQTWGLGEHGQLGGGGLGPSSVPTSPFALTNAGAASAGGYHNLVVDKDGLVWAWGLNNAGQLGDGTTTLRSNPVRVNGLSDVVAVAAGGVHSVALRSDGTLWAWGWNGFGQLGLGTTTSRSVPTKVPLDHVVAVAAGLVHTLAVTADGSVWAWGLGHVGQLGTGATDSSLVPVRVVDLPPAKAVAAGHFHSLALGRNGVVYAWGLNDVGQLGTGTTALYQAHPTSVAYAPRLDQVQAIAAGAYHSVALTSWYVYTWGLNTEGELGDGTGVNRSTPMVVPDLYTASSIAAGWYHTLVTTYDGRLLACGWNHFGQLGTGLTTDALAPVAVPGIAVAAASGGAGHSLAITARG